MGAMFGSSGMDSAVPAANSIAGSGDDMVLAPPSAKPATMQPPAPPPQLPPTIIRSAPGTDTAGAFDMKFRGTPLEGKWNAVQAAAEKYGIKPELAASVMAHESGNGKKIDARNNPGGIMDPKTNWSTKKQFDSIDKGIDSTVGTIAKNYNRAGGDIGKLALIYAPPDAANDPKGLNRGWKDGVQKQMAFFSGR